MEGTTLPKINAHSELDTDDLHGFVDEALSNVRDHIERNRDEVASFTDVEHELDEVLDNENIVEVQVRARPFENPRVTVWLKNAPAWADDAWKDHIYPNGINAYNGRVNVLFDVRPF